MRNKASGCAASGNGNGTAISEGEMREWQAARATGTATEKVNNDNEVEQCGSIRPTSMMSKEREGGTGGNRDERQR